MRSKKHSLVLHLVRKFFNKWRKLNSTQDSCKLHSATGYRVYLPATQPCTVTSTTSYRVPTGYWLHSLVHLLQQLVTECTDQLPAKQPCTVTSVAGYSMYLPASQPYTVASTGYSVPATQPCTLASTTGYRVYRLVLATQPCTLASTTGYRVYWLVLATQPCTLASIYGLQVY